MIVVLLLACGGSFCDENAAADGEAVLEIDEAAVGHDRCVHRVMGQVEKERLARLEAELRRRNAQIPTVRETGEKITGPVASLGKPDS